MASNYDQFDAISEDESPMPTPAVDVYGLPDEQELVLRTPVDPGYQYGANPPYDRMLIKLMSMRDLEGEDASASNAGLPPGHGQFRKEFMRDNPYISANVIHLSRMQQALYTPNLHTLDVDEDDGAYEEQAVMEGQWDGTLKSARECGFDYPDHPAWVAAIESIRKHLESPTTMAYWTHDGAQDSRCGTHGLHLHTLSRVSMVNDPDFLDMQKKVKAFVDGAPPKSYGRVSGLATSLFARCPFNMMKYMTAGYRELQGVKRLDWMVALKNCKGLTTVKGGGREQDALAAYPARGGGGSGGRGYNSGGRWQNNRRRRNVPYVARRHKY